MRAYFDSGVLVKLYVSEGNSASAAQTIAQFPSIRLNPLQELEIRNTFMALEGRGFITPSQRAAANHTLEVDIVTRRLKRAAPDWTQAYRVALKLCRDHTAETLARSLDILHVAIAVLEESDLFVTADARQESVAKRAGLKTRVIE